MTQTSTNLLNSMYVFFEEFVQFVAKKPGHQLHNKGTIRISMRLMYIDKAAHAKLKADLAEFIRNASGIQ